MEPDKNNEIEAVCECGELKSKCKCIEGYIPIPNAKGEIKYHIKEKLTSEEVEELYQAVMDVYVKGATSNGKPVKDKPSFNGYNLRTATKYLYQRLLGLCVKDYTIDKIEEYLENYVPIHIIKKTARVNELYEDINSKIQESSLVGNQVRQIMDKIPELTKEIVEATKTLDEKKLQELMKALNEAKSGYDEITKETEVEE